MPTIHIEMFEGRTLEQKRELAAVITRETARIAGCSLEAVEIIFTDVRKDNWAQGGVLYSDKSPT
jgi:4-oxalocrotonate tautomerase